MKLWDNKNSTNKKLDSFTIGKDTYYDLFLAEYDCLASIAHAKMLQKIGVFTKNELNKVVNELEKIKIKSAKRELLIEDDFEDIHSKIEYELTNKLGDLGKKIHTGRSRNDQILVALQLYLKKELNDIKLLTKKFFDLLIVLAKRNKNYLMPGYTHFQIAMPSSFGLWFSAYAESLIDDIEFLNLAKFFVNQNPLGSAAGFGTSFDIDRIKTTKELKFDYLKYNSMAAQISRGKVELTTSNAIASLANTLSKFAMDICLYMGKEYDFISFPNDITTGSSIMPHKKNPDVFELIRGKCNILKSLPTQMTMLTANLPSGYHREMQLAKGPIIEAVLEIKQCIIIFTESLKNIKVKKNILKDPKYKNIFSVDSLNEYAKDGMPFRDAYLKIKEEIKSKKYKPSGKISHTHIGSIGNLSLNEINDKMLRIFNK
ncbi:MAG: argininosuccinate lyase [Flavobacteriaceae bacterium]|nr:argininosuccinate lyase [Flavobacteriaceae bacterium]